MEDEIFAPNFFWLSADDVDDDQFLNFIDEGWDRDYACLKSIYISTVAKIGRHAFEWTWDNMVERLLICAPNITLEKMLAHIKKVDNYILRAMICGLCDHDLIRRAISKWNLQYCWESTYGDSCCLRYIATDAFFDQHFGVYDILINVFGISPEQIVAKIDTIDADYDRSDMKIGAIGKKYYAMITYIQTIRLN